MTNQAAPTRPAPPRADNDWHDGPGCIERDLTGGTFLSALLATVRAVWTHRSEMADYVRYGRQPR